MTGGNCIGKRLPGCKSIQLIYDRANRLVMSQDGNQQSESLWTITKYDALSRVLYTYEANPLRSPGDLRQYCKEKLFVEERADSYTAWPGMGYTLRILLPAANDYRLLTVNYYDDYSFLYIEGTAASQLAYRSKEGYGAAYSSAKGLLTGTQVFDLTDRSKYAITVYYYDEYGNPVQTRTRHVSGDYEMTYAQCDLSGNILKSYTEHLDSRGRLSVSESVENTYDRSGRLTRTDYAVNDSLSTDWRYEYDELGRISSKSIDGGLTHAKYRYNLQGWITRIEDVDFVQNLYYESFMGNYGKVRYNGNISAMNWTYRTDTDTIVNGYRFTYDAYDRLASAYSVTGSDFSSGRYHVEYEYDKHGNMVNLYRNGGRGGMIDEMNWFYEGNRVVEITDMVGEQGRYDMKEYRDYNHDGLDYFYDSNGNMTADLDRDIVAIRYNMLNLPDTVQFRNGSAIVNYYTADGKRTGSKYLTPLTTVVIPAGQTFGSTSGTAAMSSHVTARRGSLEYAGADFESDTLIRIHNGDGYLDCSEQDFRYFVRDYQGNIRTVYGSAVAKLIPVEPPFSLTNRGAIGGDKPPIRPKPIEHTVTYQRMQYYPFGLPYEAHYQPEEQPYKYGGKEFIELHGYDSYDFDARMYYPALCRFMTMDPLCEKYYSISPYAYCNNNPVKYVDPDGRDAVFIAFPDYKISAFGKQWSNLGHAGVLLIDNKTGLTKYYEYGRYDKAGIGEVRQKTISNVVIDKETGKPTVESMNKVMSEISKVGQGGRIEGAYIESDKFKEMNDYAQSKKAENDNPDRKEYSITGNNCGTFAGDVVKQDPNVKKQSPTIIDPRPNSMVKEYQDNFKPINYDPKTEKIEWEQ